MCRAWGRRGGGAGRGRRSGTHEGTGGGQPGGSRGRSEAGAPRLAATPTAAVREGCAGRGGERMGLEVEPEVGPQCCGLSST